MTAPATPAEIITAIGTTADTGFNWGITAAKAMVAILLAVGVLAGVIRRWR